MDKNITQSTQYGLYMVYLFKRDMTGFYLSLNQGITFFEKEYGKNRYINATLFADYFRNKLVKHLFLKMI